MTGRKCGHRDKAGQPCTAAPVAGIHLCHPHGTALQSKLQGRLDRLRAALHRHIRSQP